MTNYVITIVRHSVGKGLLIYTGNKFVVCECAWDDSDKIPTSTYLGCSKTHLKSKTNSKGGKREGIFIPNVAKRNGIFIHYWPGGKASIKVWSDGCTCIAEDKMLEIWNDIDPLNGKNVKVIVLGPH